MKKNTKKRKLPEQKKRILKAVDRQNAMILAERLGRITPLSGYYKSAFNLKKVLKTLGLGKYLPVKTANKIEAITKFIENMMVYHPRTIKNVMRSVLPEAIRRRHINGDPVLFDEAQALSSALLAIGVDMRKEITAMNLPKDRPTVVPPPVAIQKMLKDFKLHPAMMPECEKLFADSHINESVRKGLEKFECHIQKLSGLQEMGSDLMAKSFNEDVAKIKLNDCVSVPDRNEQNGYKFIAMGIMRWWRNNLSHGDEPQLPAQEALGRLFLTSNLFYRLDDRK